MMTRWEINGETVTLFYEGRENLVVRKTDFNRAFGTLINASYDDVKKEFAIK